MVSPQHYDGRHHMSMNDRRIFSFLAIAFGFSWSLAGVGALLGIRADSGATYTLLAALVMFGPAIAAMVQQRLIDREPWSGLGLALKGTRLSVVLLTALLGISIVPLCLLVLDVMGARAGCEMFGQVSVSTQRLLVAVAEIMEQQGVDASATGQMELLARIPAAFVLLLALVGALVAALTFNVPFMLGEELGWRGYLWQRIAHWSGLKRVAFTGVIWGLWHAPLIAMGHNYPGYPVAGIGMMVLFCVLLAGLFDWSRTRSGSVWSSVLLHGIINGSAGAMVLFAWGGHVLVGSVVGLGGFITLALLFAVVLLCDPIYRSGLFTAKHPKPIDRE
jgi:membrane protease YdiL (CAAX protease family)